MNVGTCIQRLSGAHNWTEQARGRHHAVADEAIRDTLRMILNAVITISSAVDALAAVVEQIPSRQPRPLTPAG
jgi:hypothetical protein